MTNLDLDKITDSYLLITPLVKTLIKNLSFNNDFINFCLSNKSPDKILITWEDLKLFYENNHWNWEGFLISNIDLILNEFGFVRSSTIKFLEIPDGNLNNLISILHQFSKSKVIFDNEMFNALNNSYKTKIKNDSLADSEVTVQKSPKHETGERFIFENLTKVKINPNVTIWINNQIVTSFDFISYFTSRFYILDFYLSKYFQELKNKPKKPNSTNDIEINERIFITGIITQTSLTSADLYSTRLELMNSKLQCTIVASISIQQQLKIPLGMGIGIIGKVTDLTRTDENKVELMISSETWFYPGMSSPSKKSSKKVTNESWVAVIGAINFSNFSDYSNSIIKQFVKWLQSIHENFRISYCIFAGGIISPREINNFSDSGIDLNEKMNSYSSEYAFFNSNLDIISSNIEIFIIPSNGDFTTQFLPQSSLPNKFHLNKGNIHYLQNPNALTLEGKNLSIYNPFQFSSFEPFVSNPEKFCIDLLNYRHLAPVWLEEHNIIYPYPEDALTINDDIDFMIFNHPKQAFISNYKNINILGVPSNSEDHDSEFSVLVFNLHTSDRKIIKVKI